MLKYVVTVTEDLLMVSVLISLCLALCKIAYGRKGMRFIAVGVAVGLAGAVAMCIAKHTTSKIATNQWNFYTFLVTIVLSLLFLALSLIFGRHHRQLTYYGSDTDAPIGIGGVLLGSAAAALIAVCLFYEGPEVLGYPVNFDTAGNGIISEQFAVRLVGWFLGIFLVFLFGCFLYKCTITLNSSPILLWVLNAALLTNGVRCFGMAVSKWVARWKWLTWLPKYNKAAYPWAFPLTKFVTNNILLFAFVIAGLAMVIPVILFIRNIKVHGMWDNPAQLRKLKSTARHKRRIAAVTAVLFAAAMLNLTVLKDITNRKVELSAPESYRIVNDQILIGIDQVNDGNLHRFEYVTEKGIGVRWIIVQKPGSGAYGVGLDACDVCGTAGYYQRGEQIVCKRCDVVMNINTIGFKGGCNPIPLKYKVENGSIIFEMSDILAAEREFR